MAVTSTCQGWRVQETRYSDELDDPEIGKPSSYTAGAAFIQRPDGMTRERFSLLWHVHGHHVAAKVKNKGVTNGRYFQNRIVEPVTPTFWRIDGLGEGGTPPEAAAPAPTGNAPRPDKTPDMDYQRDIAEGPGEIQFLRLPPKLFWGTEYLLATR